VVASLIDAGHSDCKEKTVCAWPEFAAWLVELCGFSWIATEVFAIYIGSGALREAEDLGHCNQCRVRVGDRWSRSCGLSA